MLIIFIIKASFQHHAHRVLKCTANNDSLFSVGKHILREGQAPLQLLEFVDKYAEEKKWWINLRI